MPEGRDILQTLHRRWRWQSLVFCGLLSVAAGLLLTVVFCHWGYASPWYGLLLAGVSFFILLQVFPSWKVTLADTARILDRSLPELEESSTLLLKPDVELAPLEKLQAARIGHRLGQQRLPQPLRKKMIMSAGLVAGVMLFWVIAGFIPHKPAPAIRMPEALKPAIKTLPPGLQTVTIRITPPAYTGRAVRSQQDLDLKVEEGSVINWEIHTTRTVDTMQFLFNDTLHIGLKAADKDRTIWRYTSAARTPGFYQLKYFWKTGIGNTALHKIETVKDEAPHISIQTPKAYTIVDFGESRKIPLAVRIQDDYGISDATVVATIATGSGEAVKFKEQTLPFGAAFTGGGSNYDLHQTLNLDALGLHPGDELYFYCKAKDNHGQESRSDMYIISLPDTAKLMSLEGLTTGLDVKPELFRSERQIIIETEQLLKGKDTTSTQAFNGKSNDLGVDQKLLRLRYGKFLGEEAEEGGSEDQFSKAGSSPADFGNAAKVLDAFTDKHDNAEDATYFEPAIKAQLKATLTEMWNAELRLRIFKPAEALPYEYKALRLLKDLQQKSRAFVAKTGVKVTPLDMKKRLTGKLDDITEPKQLFAPAREPSVEDRLRMALSILEQRKKAYSTVEEGILEEAGRQLGQQAILHPGEYLAGFQAMKRVLADAAEGSDTQMAQQAIRKLVSVPEANPSAEKTGPQAVLSQLYFSKVNNP